MLTLVQHNFSSPSLPIYHGAGIAESLYVDIQHNELLRLRRLCATTTTNAYMYIAFDEPRSSESPLDGASYQQASKERQHQLSSLETQWKEIVLDSSSGTDARALAKTVKIVFQALTLFGTSAVDLRNLPPERVNGIQLAVVLRSTFSRKKETLGWTEALKVARTALHREGKDESDVLSGLIP